jgi:hypothetical protein
MCTQEIIWCSCGHGELLPIVTCQRAESTGVCFTVVHGDHRVVLQMKCSHCISGAFEEGATLNTKARPEGALAAFIEQKYENQSLDEGREDAGAEESIGEVHSGMVNEMDGFALDPDLWQYI